MNLSPVLDTAIALIFVYVILSLVSIAVNELIVRVISLRSRLLERGLKDLLSDGANLTVFKGIYDNYMVKGLQGMERRPFWSGRKYPTGIPKRNFAQSFMQTVGEQGKATAGAAAQGWTLLQGFKHEVATTNNPALKALQPLVEEAGINVEILRKKLEDWFDQSTESLTRFYQNYTKVIALIVGVGLAAALNADSYYMATRLWQDSGLRSTLVAQSEALTTKPPAISEPAATTPEATAPAGAPKTQLTAEGRALIAKMDSLSLPIGWNQLERPDNNENWLVRILGWLFTGAAVSMGAPFWYDLLQRLVGIRASLKSKEKAPA
jgi:hypothetical protein